MFSPVVLSYIELSQGAVVSCHFLLLMPSGCKILSRCFRKYFGSFEIFKELVEMFPTESET